MIIEAVLVDFDGTLVDSEPLHCRLWQQLLRTYSVSLSTCEYQALLLGLSSSNSAALLVDRLSLPTRPQTLLEQRNAALNRQLLKTPPPLMPFARQTLLFIKQRGLQLALVTASGSQAVHCILAAYGLTDCFDVIVSGDDISRSKPDPEGYQRALQRLELEPGRAIAIEDSRAGIQAAVAAELTCLAIRSPYSQEHEFTQATERFDHLNQACEWIDERLGCIAPPTSNE